MLRSTARRSHDRPRGPQNAQAALARTSPFRYGAERHGSKGGRGCSGHRKETTERELPQGLKEDAEAAFLQRQEAAGATLLEELNEARAGTLEDNEESRRAAEDRASEESVKQAQQILEACNTWPGMLRP